MDVDAAEVFQQDDFKSLRLVLSFKNLTTRTEVRDRPRISLVEMADGSMLVEVPGKSCSPRHSVLIKIERPVRRKSKKDGSVKTAYVLLFEATGKVAEVQAAGDGFDRVLVDLVQFDMETWKRFIDFFAGRQDEIEKFLSATKG